VNYSQGWPSLVYLSTLSFFTPAQRAQLGLNSGDDFMYTELVRAHEIAHQWFGNQIGWQDYHDQWISEAFSNYAGAMYIENKYPGASHMRQILDNARESLLSEAANGESYDAIGPVWLGSRLTSAAIPDGYSETVYSKGTWIVHMLRVLMRGSGNSDDAFHKMIQDFLRTFDGREPSTWDLKRTVEKHMTKGMDIGGDATLDWFFDQWVFGTGIPTYSLDYTINESGDGYSIEGTVRQEGVPEGFVMPVPVFADDVLLGSVIVSDDRGNFKFTAKSRPSRLVLDPQGTILARIDY
jgi:aminopeptidase N